MWRTNSFGITTFRYSIISNISCIWISLLFCTSQFDLSISDILHPELDNSNESQVLHGHNRSHLVGRDVSGYFCRSTDVFSSTGQFFLFSLFTDKGIHGLSAAERVLCPVRTSGNARVRVWSTQLAGVAARSQTFSGGYRCMQSHSGRHSRG